MRKNLARIGFLLATLLLACLPAKAQDVLINYAGTSTAIVAGQTPFSFFAAGAPATNFYYYFNVSPQYSVTFYITNFGTGTDSLTVKTIFTGNPTSAAPSVNSSQWAGFSTTVIASGGTASAGATGTQQVFAIQTHQTAVMGSGISNASRIGINFSAATSSTDVIQVYAVFTPNGILGQTQVSGAQAPGSNVQNSNPVLIGGEDAGGLLHQIAVNACGLALGECLVMNTSLSAMTNILGSASSDSNEVLSPLNNAPIAVNQVDGSETITHINAAGNNTITSFGTRTDLIRVTVGSGVAATSFTVWGGGCGTGTTLSVASSANPFVFEYGAQIFNGLCISTTGAADISVVWQ